MSGGCVLHSLQLPYKRVVFFLYAWWYCLIDWETSRLCRGPWGLVGGHVCHTDAFGPNCLGEIRWVIPIVRLVVCVCVWAKVCVWLSVHMHMFVCMCAVCVCLFARGRHLEGNSIVWAFTDLKTVNHVGLRPAPYLLDSRQHTEMIQLSHCTLNKTSSHSHCAESRPLRQYKVD